MVHTARQHMSQHQPVVLFLLQLAPCLRQSGIRKADLMESGLEAAMFISYLGLSSRACKLHAKTQCFETTHHCYVDANLRRLIAASMYSTKLIDQGRCILPS